MSCLPSESWGSQIIGMSKPRQGDAWDEELERRADQERDGREINKLQDKDKDNEKIQQNNI